MIISEPFRLIQLDYVAQTSIVIIMLLCSKAAFSQVPMSLIIYEIGKKRDGYFDRVEESTGDVYVDSLSKHSRQKLENNFAISANGWMQNFRINITHNEVDTFCYITTSVYEIETVRPRKADKKKFPDTRVLHKEVWTLKTKTSLISSPTFNSIVKKIEGIDFDKIPDQDSLIKLHGFVQLDGVSYRFERDTPDDYSNYFIGGYYMQKGITHDLLLPVVNQIKSDVMKTQDYRVELIPGHCYNSGYSSSFLCN